MSKHIYWVCGLLAGLCIGVGIGLMFGECPEFDTDNVECQCTCECNPGVCEQLRHCQEEIDFWLDKHHSEWMRWQKCAEELEDLKGVEK